MIHLPQLIILTHLLHATQLNLSTCLIYQTQLIHLTYLIILTHLIHQTQSNHLTCLIHLTHLIQLTMNDPHLTHPNHLTHLIHLKVKHVCSPTLCWQKPITSSILSPIPINQFQSLIKSTDAIEKDQKCLKAQEADKHNSERPACFTWLTWRWWTQKISSQIDIF